MIYKGNQVKLARFLLLAVSEEAKTWLPFFWFNVTKIKQRFGFCDIKNHQGLSKGYQLQPSAQKHYTTATFNLYFSGYPKNLIQ